MYAHLYCTPWLPIHRLVGLLNDLPPPRAPLQVGQRVEAVVQLVKASPGYVVLSLPGSGGALAFAATTDFNMQVRGMCRYEWGR